MESTVANRNSNSNKQNVPGFCDASLLKIPEK